MGNLLVSGESMCNMRICPLTIGIETSGGVMAELIGRHSIIPTRRTQNFSTAADNRTSVLIRVFEGERLRAMDNHLLGELELTDLIPAPRGVVRIQVSAEISYDGTLTVIAASDET
jgi:heat shock protein 5